MYVCIISKQDFLTSLNFAAIFKGSYVVFKPYI